ncbi:MAG: flagellar basal body P-ring formation protein FlgA [Thermotogae bacterium]|nr:flagellar basal body P-ring formation protein FlgA [Thermotogota bacterium]
MNRLLFVICLFFIAASPIVASPPTVYLKNKVAVGSDIVTLFDVVDKHSTIDLAGATSVKICYTPCIGRKIRLSSDEVKKWLKFYLKSPFFLSSSPTSVEITRATTGIDESKMKEKIGERLGVNDIELLWTSATSVEAMDYSYSLLSLNRTSTDTILAAFKLSKDSHTRKITASFRISTPATGLQHPMNARVKEIYDMVRHHILSDISESNTEVSIQLLNKKVLRTQVPLSYVIQRCSYYYSFSTASAHVYLYEGSKFKRSLNFMFSVKKYKWMLVARKNISFNKVVEEKDVEMKRIEISRDIMREGITDLSEALGKITRQYIRKGDPIFRRYLVVPPLIKMGDSILVYVKLNDMEVSVIARALTSGGKGDIVKLKNLKSGKIISAIVKGKGIAIVPVM